MVIDMKGISTMDKDMERARLCGEMVVSIPGSFSAIVCMVMEPISGRMVVSTQVSGRRIRWME